MILASIAYAVGSLWGQRLIAHASGLTLATTSMVGGMLVLLPFGLWQLPSKVPGWKESGSVLALAVYEVGHVIDQTIQRFVK